MSYALTEFSAGYALVRLEKNDSTTLHALHKFASNKEALDAAQAFVQSELSKPLRKFLKRNLPRKSVESLAVLDTKLGCVIQRDLKLPTVHGEEALGKMRLVRASITKLLSEISPSHLHHASLGLSHSMNRYKLRFSPEKIDTMVIQAVTLLDDLDRELNKYTMRVREWYGWHFPELGKILSDSLRYAKVVRILRTRDSAAEKDFSELLTEEEIQAVREAARVSMGTEISEEDVEHICELCQEILSTAAYREQLSTYLSNRMRAIAPNLTTMVGEHIGARLIQKAGSLLALAKFPASTVQILGAEKALFRALKKKQATPKYGILYNASLVTQTPSQYKGTMSRVLAAKTSLSARVDSFTESDSNPAAEYREKVKLRLESFDKEMAYGKMGKMRGTANLRSKRHLELEGRGAKSKTQRR